MISFGNATLSRSGLIPLKTAYKKEENCSGRSRVRRILVTCIQLLLLQFLHVIWSMPTIFAFFKKPLDKFFINFAIPRSIVYKYTLQVLRTLKTEKAFKQGLRYSNIQIFPPDFVFTSERPHYSLALFPRFICTCPFSKKIEFASKRTLD